MADLAATPPVTAPVARRRRSRFWRKVRRQPLGIAALVGIVLLALMVTVGPELYPHSPSRTAPLHTLKPPTTEHWLGTDELGRDVFARILAGGRVSLAVGLVSMLVGLLIGSLAGAAAGYFGGLTESVIMRLVDVFMAIPAFFLILVIVTSFGNHPLMVILTVGFSFWPQMARPVYAEFKKFRQSEFVEASQALGGGHLRVMLKHIFPQVLPQAIVLATLGVGWAILSEAGLSYLGLGIQPPLASWGNMLQNAQAYLWLNPMLAIYPGVFIAVTVLLFNLLGNSLRDVLDPRG
ncbi:MAG: ABC transporter permease [Deinococcales bacterium]|nr:ABC transporter permease [Deinococcales bacterium]